MIDRKEALTILGMTEDSLHSDIEIRYATLVKRYRAEQNNEKLEEISLAYNIVTGRHVEKEPEDPRMKDVVFGKTRKEWSNIWLYGKFKFGVIAVVAAFLIYMIYSIATNTPADFKIAAVGDFYVSEAEITEDYVKTLFPEFKKVEIATAYLTADGGSEYGAANIQKAMILVTVSGEDIIIVDKANFERYAGMGAFVAIDDLYNELNSNEASKSLLLKSATAAVKDSEDVAGPTKIYGIDLSTTQFLNGIGILGRDQIITVSIKSQRPEKAREFIRKLIADNKNILPKVTLIPSATPTPIPTPIPTPTAKP
jgi:hypothetical protein